MYGEFHQILEFKVLYAIFISHSLSSYLTPHPFSMHLSLSLFLLFSTSIYLPLPLFFLIHVSYARIVFFLLLISAG